MINDLEPNPTPGRAARGRPSSIELGAPHSRAHALDPIYRQLSLTSSVQPAFVFRNLGLLDRLNEPLTRYHE